jgi:hypothetical protein
MATRSTIAMVTTDGSLRTIRAIYCHWDGDIVGQILSKNYADTESVTALLDEGNLSSLGASLSETTSYKTMQGRDEPAVFFESEADWLAWADRSGCEYAYLYGHGVWNQERV